MEEISELFVAAPENDDTSGNGGHARAGYHLWRSVTRPGAFNFDEGQILIAAATTVGEPRISRDFGSTV